MSKIDKLIVKMVEIPNDFRETELDRVLTFFSYKKLTASGSGIKYICEETNSTIHFHRPHSNGANIRVATIRDVVGELRRTGRIACA